MSLNLYEVKILRDERLYESGGMPLKNLNYNDSFFYPEIIPKSRVGRWDTTPKLTEFVQMFEGQTFEIQIFNYTYFFSKTVVKLDDTLIGTFYIKPNSNITLPEITYKMSNETGNSIVYVSFIPELRTEQAVARRLLRIDQFDYMNFDPSRLVYNDEKVNEITTKIYGRKKFVPLNELIPTSLK